MTILDEIAAALNRRNQRYRDKWNRPDNCPDCQALRRSRTFRCGECGYLGVPAVLGCSCAVNQAVNLADWRRRRAEVEAGTSIFGFTMEKVAGELALAEAAPRAQRCHATTDTREMFRAVEAGQRWEGCNHGTLQCPVCADYGEGGDREHAYHIIRDLRKLLRSVGVQT